MLFFLGISSVVLKKNKQVLNERPYGRNRIKDLLKSCRNGRLITSYLFQFMVNLKRSLLWSFFVDIDNFLPKGRSSGAFKTPPLLVFSPTKYQYKIKHLELKFS